MTTPKALLVDLDDTLICFDDVAHSAWKAACAAACAAACVEDGVFGMPVEVLAEEIWNYSHWFYSDPVRHREGRNALEDTRRHIVKKVMEKRGIDDPEIAFEIADTYSRIREERLYVFPGVYETLKELKSRGIPLVMITNGESRLQRRKIERFEFTGYFESILIEGELGYGKPDPLIFEDALCFLNMNASDVWVIGDNYDWEVAAPSALGFTCIWRDKRDTGLPVGADPAPDAVIKQFSEIPALIDRVMIKE
jgi:putative hydrolase of the HAD superfamily